MKYVINVAKRIPSVRRPGRYIHYFRAELMDEIPAAQVLKELRSFYPAPEYEVDATLWKQVGQDCTHTLLKVAGEL